MNRMFKRKKPMTKRERTKQVTEARSAQMRSRNESRRSATEARTAAGVGKNIAYDRVTAGLYSKAKFSYHIGNSFRHRLEGRKQLRIAKKARRALRKNQKRSQS